MKNKSIVKLGGLAVALALVAWMPIRGEEKTDLPLIAKAAHTCGERSYVLESGSLSVEDQAAIRDILSFLYTGANILFQYPGSPTPVLNEQTRKSLNSNSYAIESIKSQFKHQYKVEPTPEQLEQEIEAYFSRYAVDYTIHEGPKPERIKQILADPRFSKRLGTQAIKLIESRLKGEVGQRPQILAELATQFNVKEVPNYWSDENCHIYNGFGLD